MHVTRRQTSNNIPQTSMDPAPETAIPPFEPRGPLRYWPLGGQIIAREAVTLGCAGAAGLYRQVTSREEVVDLLCTAVRRNVTRLDTAPLYGCGRSELDIGHAFAAEPGLMLGVRVATKVGRRCLEEAGETVKALDSSADEAWRVEHDREYYARDRDTGHLVCVADYSADGIVKSFAESRQRLEAAGSREAGAAIETLRIHDVESEQRWQDLVRGGGVAALATLKRDGLVGRIGLGMNKPDFILRIIRQYPGVFDSVLMAGAWNLMDLSGREVLEECEAQGIEVHIAGVFGAGLLWGTNHYRYHAATDAEKARRNRLQAVCASHGIPLPWLAMHFATRPRCVSQLVIGARTAAELNASLDLLDAQVPEHRVGNLYAALTAEGLLPQAAYR
jgi:D-threo-aldose 1-dehydrogenase